MGFQLLMGIQTSLPLQLGKGIRHRAVGRLFLALGFAAFQAASVVGTRISAFRRPFTCYT